MGNYIDGSARGFGGGGGSVGGGNVGGGLSSVYNINIMICFMLLMQRTIKNYCGRNRVIGKDVKDKHK